ncbi:MAG: flagellar hook-length control protein FliK [Candidatus Marinimicrobia bacterium]|nr:flagellar hook-length control protein FliK [Candidatus Neomarinimicrobiota bacterium]
MNLSPIKDFPESNAPNPKEKNLSGTMPMAPFGEIFNQLHSQTRIITKPNQVKLPLSDKSDKNVAEQIDAIGEAGLQSPDRPNTEPPGITPGKVDFPETLSGQNVEALTVKTALTPIPTVNPEIVASTNPNGLVQSPPNPVVDDAVNLKRSPITSLTAEVVKPVNSVTSTLKQTLTGHALSGTQASQIHQFAAPNQQQSIPGVINAVPLEKSTKPTQSLVNGVMPATELKDSSFQWESNILNRAGTSRHGVPVDVNNLKNIGADTIGSAPTRSPEISTPNLSSGRQTVSPAGRKSPEKYLAEPTSPTDTGKAPRKPIDLGMASKPTHLPQIDEPGKPKQPVRAGESIPPATNRTAALNDALANTPKPGRPAAKPISSIQSNEVNSKPADADTSNLRKPAASIPQTLEPETKQSDHNLMNRPAPLQKSLSDIKTPAPPTTDARQAVDQLLTTQPDPISKKIKSQSAPVQNAAIRKEMNTDPLITSRVAVTLEKPISDTLEINRKRKITRGEVPSSDPPKASSVNPEIGKIIRPVVHTATTRSQQASQNVPGVPTKPEGPVPTIQKGDQVKVDTQPADHESVKSAQPPHLTPSESQVSTTITTTKTGDGDTGLAPDRVDPSIHQSTPSSAGSREPATILPQMVHRVLSMLEGRIQQQPGMQQMQVKSGSWGTLNIQLSHDTGNRAVTIIVENESTRDAVRGSLPALLANLERKGIVVQNIDVRLPWEGGADKQTQGNQDQNFQKNFGAHADSDGRHEAGTPRRTGNGSGSVVREYSQPGKSSRDFGYNTMEITA